MNPRSLASILAATLCLFAGGAAADAARVHVRGAARIDAHVAGDAGRLVVSGRVTDDTAEAPGEAPALDGAARPMVALRVTAGPGGEAIALASAAPEACPDAGARPVLESPERLLLPADGAGLFCVRLALPGGRGVAHLDLPPSARMDGARLDVPIDLALRPVTLAFDDERPALSLDAPAATIGVTAAAPDGAGSRAAPAGGLALSLASESGADLGDAVTDAGGHARFVVPSSRLGPPGRGELRVSFAGDSNAAPSAAAIGVERRTGVELRAPDAAGRALPPAPADDDVAIRVVARAACVAAGCAAPPGGTIEALVGEGRAETIVGAAPLERGAARVVVHVAQVGGATSLRLRYVPEVPWFEAPGDLSVAQPVRPPGPWGHVILVGAGLAVLAWLGVARFPPRSLASARARRPSIAPDVREPLAGVALILPGAPGRWSGSVADAHDGAGVPGARVAVERPAFDGVHVVAQAVSDAAGSFVVASDDTAVGDEIVVEGRFHSAVRRPLPPPGEIAVALVQRRRILIDQLVAWARGRGRPFDARPDPTPEHVRRAAERIEIATARRAQASRIERWAGEVERAAYGGAPVDAQAQAEIRAACSAGRAEGERASPGQHVDCARRRSL